jgi:hypothetical protein
MILNCRLHKIKESLTIEGDCPNEPTISWTARPKIRANAEVIDAELPGAIRTLSRTSDRTKAVGALDTLCLACLRGGPASRSLAEQAEVVQSAVSLLDAWLLASAASTWGPCSHRAVEPDAPLAVGAARLLRLVLARSPLARRHALRAGAPRALSAALASPASPDPLLRACAGALAALCRDGPGARAAAAAGAATALADLLLLRRRGPGPADRAVRRAAAAALDGVVAAPAGAEAAALALPGLTEALARDRDGPDIRERVRLLRPARDRWGPQVVVDHKSKIVTDHISMLIAD